MIENYVFGSESIFTPNFTFSFHRSKCPINNHTLAFIVLREGEKILKQFPEEGANKNWLTSKLWKYNLLDWNYPEIKQLKEFIREQYVSLMREIGRQPEKTYIQCWANILNDPTRCIVPHHHADGHSGGNVSQSYSYLSGNLCVETYNTNTYFRNPFLDKDVLPIPNVDGELIMFPSFIVHWTDYNQDLEPRITISFDIIKEEFYKQIDGKNYRELT
jgi:alpha-N-acetylglucosamine transferase